MKKFAAVVGAVAGLLAVVLEGYRVLGKPDAPANVVLPCPQPAYHVRPAGWSPSPASPAESNRVRRPEPVRGCDSAR